MDEHNRPAQGTSLLQRILEVKIVIILQTHSTKNDDVNLRLHGDTGQKLVVGLAGNGKDWQLLGNHQGVEHIDHGDTGTNHPAGHDAL